MTTNEPRIYSADEVASELGITPQRVRALAQSRGVGTKVGGYMWTFTPSDIDAMRERKPGRPAKESNMSSDRPVYYVERIKADHLGDTSAFNDAEIAGLIDRQEAAITEALDSHGYDVEWEDIRTWRVGTIGNVDAPPSDDDIAWLEQVVADAASEAMDAWYAAGCPASEASA